MKESYYTRFSKHNYYFYTCFFFPLHSNGNSKITAQFSRNKMSLMFLAGISVSRKKMDIKHVIFYYFWVLFC